MKRLGKLTLATTVVLALGLSPLYGAEDYTKLFQPVARGDQSTESVYFVMTDRFANGSTANDGEDFDPTDIGYWHGGDFIGLTQRLDYIKKLGHTAIWITPPIKQQSLQGNSSAYHGYWGLDFMSIDPHLGTAEEFKAFIDRAHELGLKVILDVVANHTADVIKYQDGKAFIPQGKESVKNPAFLNNIKNYHNQGDSTFEGESSLVGDFFGLDDLATENPEVVKGFIEIWSYWIKTYGIDGLRIDTFKHVNPEFWKKVLPEIQSAAKAAGKKNFPIFGEVFDASPENLATYMTSGQVPSLLDFAFNEQVTRYVASYGSADRLAQLFNADDLYTTSKTSAYGLATFLGNHDIGRIGKTILANAVDNDAALRQAKIAQAALLLLRGGPVSYYGDEKGMTGGGGDKLARQDMFSTQVSQWQYEQRIGSGPIENRSSFDVENPLEVEITKIQSVIRENPALRSGTQQTLAAQGQLFVVARYADKSEYIVAFNTGDSAKSLLLAPVNQATTWSALLGSCSLSANRTLEIPANNYCVLKAVTPLGKSLSTKITAPKLESSNDSPLWPQLSITVNKPGYNSVTFLAREKGKKWVSLGTSDRPTFQTSMTAGNRYRLFLRNGTFKKNAPLEVIALLKNSDNKVIASTITKVKGP